MDRRQSKTNTEYLRTKDGEDLEICRQDQVVPVVNKFKYTGKTSRLVENLQNNLVKNSKPYLVEINLHV